MFKSAPMVSLVRNAQKMPVRRSVTMDDTVEAIVQRARGYLISSKGIDVDNTQAANIFLVLGALRYVTSQIDAKMALTELETKSIEALSVRNDITESNKLWDEISTIMLRMVERNQAKVVKNP